MLIKLDYHLCKIIILIVIMIESIINELEEVMFIKPHYQPVINLLIKKGDKKELTDFVNFYFYDLFVMK